MDEKQKCSQGQESAPQETPVADQTGTSEDSPLSSRNQLFISTDQSASSKEQPAVFKDLSEVTLTTQSTILIDQSITSRIQVAQAKEQSFSSRNQATTSIAYNSGVRSPRHDESRISFCVARAASATLSYGRNSSYLSSYPPLIIRPSVITMQPRLSRLPSPASIAIRIEPQSLFLQALSKLNETSLPLTVINNLKLLRSSTNLSKVVYFDLKSGDITPPDSLTSAPPSYSFVLRQMAVRRRPRLMGTFFPSPSFVQQTPPPTYTTAFDVYIEPPPPPPARVYTFGFAPMPIVCPECGFTGMTVVSSRITICTHLCAFILCLLCCWICAPLPYVLRSCKDVYHYCRNCRSFLGMYCPTNPENCQ